MVLYARDIVEKDFLSLSANTNILEGAKAMKNSKHGFAIIGTPASPEGIVTEWDIVAKVVAEGRDPARVTLREVMSTELLSVEAGAGLSSVSQLMTERGVRRLLVKDGNQVIGFITSKTMLARMNEYVDKISSQISRLQTPWF
ncbi:MAG TPA: CBS domain-containing protein [Nitrososphaerales archaeon]|nr:CBS domain-containing protein [Nitrososphaerales archaeon]